jgi:2-polyprenyl-3-methyl-5-hydroxy-6-metoxy-1,4-benzoquinol methylase
MPTPVETCVVCNSKSYSVDHKATYELNLIEPFRVEKCSNCGLRWLNPVPTDQEYELIYTASYFSKIDHAEDIPDWIKQFPSPSSDLPERDTGFTERLHRLNKLSPTAKSIIDIGTGSGSFLAVARDMGWEIEGIELSEFGCQTALNLYGIVVKQTTLDKYDAQGRTFDVVHLSHVFEHFTHPDIALDNLIKLMHPGSLLVIEVPNQFNEWVHSFVRLVKRIPRSPRNLFSIHHPYFFRPQHIVEMCEKRGLTAKRVSTHFPERWTGSIQRRILGFIDRIADLIGRHGTNIEVIATISNH